MLENNALILGYNDYTFEIEKNIKSYYKNVHIFSLHKDVENSFNLSDNWDDLSSRFDMSDCVAFCVLEDMAENIFLTISLRDTFKELTIVSLAQDKESEDKLKLVGATKILPTTQTTANIIVEMLEKPIVTEVLHNILYEKSDLKIAQIKVEDNTFFDGKYPSDVEWSREHGIIVISIVNEDMSREFIYSSKAKHHIIRSGDIFIVVGYEKNIKEFEKLIGVNVTKIGVIGAGKWGSALAFALSEKNKVLITSRTPRDIKNFVSLDEILKLEYLVIAIPAQQISSWLKENFVFNNQKILVAAKGIEASSGRFLNDIYKDYVPDENIAFLSGPSFATEVRKSLPTALVINSHNEELSVKFSTFFPSFIKTYTSTDVMGAEVAGAYKNVIAIAAGICEGLGLGKNAAASLISRGLVEMQRFGYVYGAKEESFVGLSGAGDLFLTASMTMSRNFRVGLGIAQGKNQDQILQELGEVAEGIGTTYALNKIAKNRDLYLPIAKEVYKMLEGENPKVSLNNFLSN